MVWIRIDEDFPDHPKLFLLESRLEPFDNEMDTPSKADAMEVIFRLFKLAMKVDPVHGELTKYQGQLEKLICGCRVFGPSVETLTEVGFIDRREDGRIYVHDWWEVNGKFVQKLITDRDRKRAAYSEERERRVLGGSDVSPHHKGERSIHGDSVENPGNGGVNDTVRDGTERNGTETDDETGSESPSAPCVGGNGDSNNPPPKKKKRSVFKKPLPSEVQAYLDEKGETRFTGQGFFDSNEGKGWVVGTTKTPMKDWRAVVRTWISRRDQDGQKQKEGPQHVGAPRNDAAGGWMYGSYRRSCMEQHGNHSRWMEYTEASTDYPEESAPTFDDWLLAEELEG